MKKLGVYFLIVHTAVFLISGFGIHFILKEFFPDTLVSNFYIIPLYFFLLGVAFIFKLKQTPLEDPRKLVNLYMLMRMAKIFVSAAFMLINWFIDKNNIRNFAIIFAVFYLINLISETFIYMRMELYIKRKNAQKEYKEYPDESLIDR